MSPSEDAEGPRWPAEAGETYAEFIAKELDDLRASKASLEQRGVAVVSTSGVLVTLLFGFSAIARKGGGLHVPTSARPWFYVGLAGFVIAAALGLVANIPRTYKSPKSEGFKSIVRHKWRDEEAVARRRVAMTRIDIFHSYRSVNKFKANVLAGAIGSEVAAVMCLAVAIGLVIAHS